MTSCLFRIQYADGRIEERQLAGGVFRIGRERGEVVLNDPSASAAHGELAVHGSNVTYTDLGSSNGSFDAYDRRLTGSSPLSPGQSVQVGRCAITFLGTVNAPSPTSAERAAAALAEPVAQGARPAISKAPAVASEARGNYSHPDRSVRHSYPLAISAAGVSEAVRLLLQTAPFVLARLGVLGGLAVAAIVWWSLLIGGFVFLARATPLLGWGWAVLWCFVAGGVWRFAARYVLYLLKAAHIAVLTELITTGRISNGSESMFHYGKRIVTERFGQVNVMFGLGLLIDGIVSAFNRTLSWVAELLPIPGLGSLMRVVNSVTRASTTYVDEAIFSYDLARGDDNAYRSAKDGLIYYAQNAREILKTGVWAVVIDRVLSTVIWSVMLVPAIGLSYLLPGAASLAAIVIALLLAGCVRSAVLRPLLLTLVLVKYHSLVRGQAIDPVMDQRLSVASTKFGELKKKAETWVRPAPAPEPARNVQLA
jgi:hypothetical protein